MGGGLHFDVGRIALFEGVNGLPWRLCAGAGLGSEGLRSEVAVWRGARRTT